MLPGARLEAPAGSRLLLLDGAAWLNGEPLPAGALVDATGRISAGDTGAVLLQIG